MGRTGAWVFPRPGVGVGSEIAAACLAGFPLLCASPLGASGRRQACVKTALQKRAILPLGRVG